MTFTSFYGFGIVFEGEETARRVGLALNTQIKNLRTARFGLEVAKPLRSCIPLKGRNRKKVDYHMDNRTQDSHEQTRPSN